MITTVLGEVEENELGVTLSHEHICEKESVNLVPSMIKYSVFRAGIAKF